MSDVNWHVRGSKPSALHRLSWKEKRQARQLAADAYRSAKGDPETAQLLTLAIGGDKEAAEKLIRSQPKAIDIDAATIALIIIGAILLWIWWNQENVENPGDRPLKDEPVFPGDATEEAQSE